MCVISFFRLVLPYIPYTLYTYYTAQEDKLYYETLQAMQLRLGELERIDRGMRVRRVKQKEKAKILKEDANKEKEKQVSCDDFSKYIQSYS